MKNINYLIIILFVTFLLFSCKKRLDDDILAPKTLDTGYYDRVDNKMIGRIDNLHTLSVEKFGHVWGRHKDVKLDDSGVGSTSFPNIITDYVLDTNGVVIDTIFLFDEIDEKTFYSDLSSLEIYEEYYINIYFVDVHKVKRYGDEQIIYRCH